MTTATASAGVSRPQTNPDTGSARESFARSTPSTMPNRNAEDPFAAQNGTLRFASERKAAPARSTSPARGTTAAKSTATAPKRSASGGSQPPKKRKKRRRKNKRLFLFALCTLLFAVLLLGAVIIVASCSGGSCQSSPDDPNVQPGGNPDASPAVDTPAPVSDDSVITQRVTVEGVSLQNLTVAEARRKVVEKLDAKKNSVSITVAYQNYDPLTLNAEAMGLTYSEEDVERVLTDAANGSSAASSIPMTVDGEKLRSALYTLNDKIPNHAVNARAEVKYKSTTIDGRTYYQPYWAFTAGENGAKIDFDALEKQIADAIDAGNYTASLTPSVTVSEPEITEASLRSQLTLLSSYTTTYYFKGTSSTKADVVENRKNRDINISKASEMMRVVELKPGKSFSFNKTTGERSEKKGWALANAIMDQTYTKEPGGGVCQVSTTIFNAILRAGITDINRRGHTIPSDYVTSDFKKGLGFDATVDYGHIDFGFKNTTDSTIYMFVYITKNKDSNRKKVINVEIYGKKEEGVEYRLRNEILEETSWKDESKYEFKKDKTMLETAEWILLRNPHDGYKVKTYVDKYKDGKFVETVRTEQTIYDVIYPKYQIGTATVTPPPTPTPKPTATPKPDPTPEAPSGSED